MKALSDPQTQKKIAAKSRLRPISPFSYVGRGRKRRKKRAKKNFAGD
jgi:hypothetical protein